MRAVLRRCDCRRCKPPSLLVRSCNSSQKGALPVPAMHCQLRRFASICAPVVCHLRLFKVSGLGAALIGQKVHERYGSTALSSRVKMSSSRLLLAGRASFCSASGDVEAVAVFPARAICIHLLLWRLQLMRSGFQNEARFCIANKTVQPASRADCDRQNPSDRNVSFVQTQIGAQLFGNKSSKHKRRP